jgi:hypothetical protein
MSFNALLEKTATISIVPSIETPAVKILSTDITLIPEVNIQTPGHFDYVTTWYSIAIFNVQANQQIESEIQSSFSVKYAVETFSPEGQLIKLTGSMDFDNSFAQFAIPFGGMGTVAGSIKISIYGVGLPTDPTAPPSSAKPPTRPRPTEPGFAAT